MEIFMFYLLAILATASALIVIAQRNPVYSALSLIFTFLCIAGFYVLLNAQFIAAIQVIVYAGAIMVLFLFVIMLLYLKPEELILRRHRLQKFFGILFGIILIVQIAFVSTTVLFKETVTKETLKIAEYMGTTEAIGLSLYKDFIFPFEVASVLLLVGIIGAIILAKREL